MWRPSVVLFLCLLTFESGIIAQEDQDSGFMNRAIKHSLKTRQLILGYKGSTKMRKTICTPPCTLRPPWVSVTPRPRNPSQPISTHLNPSQPILTHLNPYQPISTLRRKQKKVSELLSASVEKFFISRMRDIFYPF